MLHASCPVIVSTWNSVPLKSFLGTKPYNIRCVVSKSGHFTHDMTFFHRDVRGKRFNAHGT